jgi:MarR family transcriptional regulator, organic hydroperoxide resistance regulator
MSISKARRRRKGAVESIAARRGPGRGGDASAPPVTVSHAALLERGSDRRFRQLVYDLLTVATRMDLVRAYLGRQIGLSGPQYSLIIAVAHLQGEQGVSVGSVAGALHVSSAFITAETGKLARRGLLWKRPNPADRRSVLLTLSPRGRLAIDGLNAKIRAVNDQFFGRLDRRSFLELSKTAAQLIAGSDRALRLIDALDNDVVPVLHAAE